MSMRQRPTKNTSRVPKKPLGVKNNSSNAQVRRSPMQGNANRRGAQGQNLGGFGQMSSAPIAMSTSFKSNRPKMTTLRNGDCRIVHREYIQDILSGPVSSGFTATLLSINPGLASTFQWLSKVAQNFESYKFSKLKFCYETESPSSTGGTVVLAVDYDAADPVVTSKQQALAYRGSVRSAPWTPSCHSSLPEDLSKNRSYYVRPGIPPANTDIRLYDVGNLQFIVQGVTGTLQDLGELYVEYDVLLMTPIYEPVPSSGTITTATSTTSNVFAAHTTQGGGFIVTPGNTGLMNFSNLQIGSELSISVNTTAGTTTVFALGTLIGLTAKTTYGGTGTLVETFTVTANLASATLTAATFSAGDLLVIVAVIPLSAY